MKKGSLKDRIKESFIYQELARAGKVLTYSPKHRYSTLATALFAGGSLACGDGPIDPVDEMPRITSSYLSPTSGMAPLSVDAGLRCEDDRGIKEYTITKGSEIIKRTAPIDTILTYTESGMGDLSCTDTGGQTVHYRADINITPQPTRGFSQETGLENLVNIRYNAAFQNLDSAQLDISKDGQRIISKKIMGPNYTELLSYSTDTSITKGKYDFTATWKTPAGKDTSVTVRDSIPTYPFAMDLSSVDLDEEADTTITLPNPIYTNPEDNPAIWTGAAPTDGKTTVNLNGSQLTTTGNTNQTGNYSLRLNVRSKTGRIDSTTSQGFIHDLLDVSGFLEDNEEHKRQPGLVRIYKAADSTMLGEIQADGSGSFSEKLEQRVSNLTGDILIQARRIENGVPTSYIRTIKVPAQDQRGLLMKVVPYGSYIPEEFKQFMTELAGSTPNTRFDFNGEFIPGFQGLKGIEILNENPFGTQYGTFTPDQQTNIKSKILEPNDISGIIGKYTINPDSVLIGNHGHFALDNTTQEIIPGIGWVIVSPKSNMVPNGLTKTYGGTGTLVWGGTVYLKSGAGDGTISHEFGHMFIGGGHPKILPDQTIMNASTTLSTTGTADKKAGKIIYEPTFMIFPPGKFPNVDNLDNILGWGFLR